MASPTATNAHATNAVACAVKVGASTHSPAVALSSAVRQKPAVVNTSLASTMT
jgi:hypothetical protein